MNFTELLPWASLIFVFGGMLALQWRIIGALDKALERQQSSGDALGVAVPKAPPATKPPAPLPVAVSISQSDALVLTPGFQNFVKKREGFSAKAYGDYKQYSIGYGTRAKSPDEVITEPEAYHRMMTELTDALNAVRKFLPSNAPIGVLQGMTDATYNLGTAWQHQALGSLLAQGQYEDAKSHLMQYDHAGGQVNAGLTERRKAECDMFDNPL